ncbi:MAG: CBASS oligonucleotide cyclase [Gammaproteobacteria bacterium]|nr:CBASS oligonucleotide cyclase [Gammaproteobacteria bacterium]MCY4282185.1 CBASS oligonucleotide cyclase [Gammaproteobacteria bacterium]MCY4304744.1 CBASS oligonucleotide cyclase [Aestuariivita sp.]
MSRKHIDHRHIQDFADRVVNLNRDDARKYREQVNRLRVKVEDLIVESPDFELRKMLLSGSLAKHTALKNINDVDVAVYVTSAPEDVGELISWLAGKLHKVFPNFSRDQVVVQNYSVKVEFRGTSLDVDIVPVYQKGEDDRGQLVSQEDGTRLQTNVTLHKEFITKRRKKYATYTQVVRLLKWWVKVRKEQGSEFKFKSFMVELVLAKLFDDNKISNVADYPETLLDFFDYIVRTNFSEEVFFTDYVGGPTPCNDPIRVFDPVNPDNNLGRKYSASDRDIIVSEAVDAGDAIEAALKAPTKELTMYYWRKVYGPSFSI